MHLLTLHENELEHFTKQICKSNFGFISEGNTWKHFPAINYVRKMLLEKLYSYIPRCTIFSI